MKKETVLTVVACSIIALVLTAVLAVGLSTDGFGIKSAREEANSAEAHLVSSDGDRYEYSWDPAEDGTDGLSIHWSAGAVDIKVGTGNLIKITEQADKSGLSVEEQLQLNYSDGVLEIDWGEKALPFFDFSFFDQYRKDLTVELPQGFAGEMSVLSVSNASGDITIGGCTAEAFSVSSASGDLHLVSLSGADLTASTTSGAISLSNARLSGEVSVNTVSGKMELETVTAGTARMDTVSGTASFEGRADEFHGDSVSAALSASLSNCPKILGMNAVSGRLTLKIPENKGFYADYSSVSGSFHSDFPVEGGIAKSGKARYGDGKCDFSFSTTSGDIYIEELKN